MRTRLAKILIFFNLGMSLVFAAWALALYTQRVEWGPKGASATQVAGEMFKRTEEINKLKGARTRAEQHWETALADLRRLYAQSKTDEAWYREKLAALETSPKPVETLAPDKQSIGSLARPQLVPWIDNEGKPVSSLAVQRKQIDQVHRDIETETTTLNNLVAQEKQLTQQLIGDGMNKGIREFIRIEEEKRQNAEKEQDYLEPLLYNRLVELSLLQKRNKILDGRLKEVQKLGVAAANP